MNDDMREMLEDFEREQGLIGTLIKICRVLKQMNRGLETGFPRLLSYG